MVPARFFVNNGGDPFGALVVAYSDGTVQVTTGGIDLGQGLNTKVAQATAMALGCDLSLITVMPVSTAVTANCGATGGSVTSEICVSGAIQACAEVTALLAPIKKANPTYTWTQLCAAGVGSGLDLRGLARAVLQGPANGQPDKYQTWGVCIMESYLDILTGEYQFLRCDILMDLGISMNPLLDIGQIEGAFLMGAGYHTSEENLYNQTTGQLITNDTWEYKIPGIMDVPIDWRVTLLPNAPNPTGVLRSRAVGEPPLLMGCAALFALRYAVNASRNDFAIKGRFDFDSPATVANVAQVLVREGVLSLANFGFSGTF
jgi:xanthine dehydrogenase/oxidase